jgi:hypothetical protein
VPDTGLPAIMAILLVDGAPLRICAPYCLTRWSKDGTFLFVFLWRSRREPVRGEAWQFQPVRGKACRIFQREVSRRWPNRAWCKEPNRSGAEHWCRARTPRIMPG